MSAVDPAQLANAYANRGWLAHDQGHEEDFHADTERALELLPEHRQIGFNMALAALLTGRAEQASALYREHADGCSEPELLRAALDDLLQVPPGDRAIAPEQQSALQEMLEQRLMALHAEAAPGP